MKSTKEIAILFFIIVVLVFYISSQKNEKTHYELPDVQKIDAQEISKIKIKKPDAEIILVREGDTWRAGEKKYPADARRVENMLSAISGLTLTALASESENYAMFDLDEEHRVDVEAYSGDSLIRKIAAGKNTPTYQQTFVMFGDDPRVYHSRGAIRRDFDLTLSELRDKQVMSFSDEITEIFLKKGTEEMKIIRDAAPQSVDLTEKQDDGTAQPVMPKWITADGRKVKETEIDSMVQALSDYQCDEFIEDKRKDDFRSPIFTATLTGVKDYTISFFEKKDDKYGAVTSESEYPFLVSEWKAKKIMKDFTSLLEKE